MLLRTTNDCLDTLRLAHQYAQLDPNRSCFIKESVPMALIDNPTVPECRKAGESRAGHPKTECFAQGDLEAQFLLGLIIFEEALKTIQAR